MFMRGISITTKKSMADFMPSPLTAIILKIMVNLRRHILC